MTSSNTPRNPTAVHAGTVNHWSRQAGVSLRPWSGRAPLGLLVRGLLQVAISAAVAWFAVAMMTSDEITTTADELTALRNLAIVILVAVVILGLIGAVKAVVGAVDLVRRRTVTGRVVSVRERRLGDVLPRPVQRALFDRRDTGTDRRRTRSEVVLNTPDGLRQWTVRRARLRRGLRVDEHVRLTVSPIMGYVAQVESLQP